MRKIILIIFATAIITSCTDATISQFGALNDEHKIEMYSGGVKVKEWISTGKVNSVDGSDGYFFRDKECQCNVEVSGDVVVTRIMK